MGNKYPYKIDGKPIRLYRIWGGMKTRCNNSNVKSYPYYGGRGITVCSEWLCWDNFYEWAMANGYRDDLTIDRIDNDGNYEPSNCRWATRKEQSRNYSKNVYVGDELLCEVAERLGTSHGTISHRLKNNLEVDAPIKSQEKIIVQGKALREISVEYNVSYSLISARYQKFGARTIDDLVKAKREILVEGVSLSEISKSYGIDHSTLWLRWKSGYKTIAELVDPVSKNVTRRVDGKPLKDISSETGIPYTTLCSRWRRGARTLKELLKDDLIRVEGKTLVELSEETGVLYKTLLYRYNLGCKTVEELLAGHRRTLYVEGISLKDLEKISGINYDTLRYRYKKGKRTILEITSPVKKI